MKAAKEKGFKFHDKIKHAQQNFHFSLVIRFI
jgi:hypothetical protein